jgi:hypothetical protein
MATKTGGLSRGALSFDERSGGNAITDTFPVDSPSGVDQPDQSRHEGRRSPRRSRSMSAATARTMPEWSHAMT